MHVASLLHVDVVRYRRKQAQQGRQAISLAESSRIHLFLDVSCFFGAMDDYGCQGSGRFRLLVVWYVFRDFRQHLVAVRRRFDANRFALL